jgi:hypothetical protein
LKDIKATVIGSLIQSRKRKEQNLLVERGERDIKVMATVIGTKKEFFKDIKSPANINSLKSSEIFATPNH